MAAGEMCARPKPQVVQWRHPMLGPDAPLRTSIICSDCSWDLALLEYEQGDRRMRWWRHVKPPVGG